MQILGNVGDATDVMNKNKYIFVTHPLLMLSKVEFTQMFWET